MFSQMAANLLDMFQAWKRRVSVDTQEIYEAVSKKDHKQLKTLLNYIYLNVIYNKNYAESALDLAAKQGDEVSVELLLAHGAIPDYDRPIHIWGCSTLSRAICSGNHKVIRLLISHGSNPDTLLKVFNWGDVLVNTSPYNYWFKCIEMNDLSIFKLLLECTGRKVCDNKWNQKMLLTACSLGSTSIVGYLLDQGVSVESKDKNGWTCVFFAVACMSPSIFQLLITRGANLKHKDLKGRNLLHIAAFHYLSTFHSDIAFDIIQMLIDNDLDINATDSIGLTPINKVFTVTWFSIPDILGQFLCHPKIDISKPDIDGVTVLHRAVRKRFESILVKILCMPDVDINVRDKLGRTPLHFIDYSCLSNLSILLEFGANTKVLHGLDKEILEDKNFLKILGRYQIMRKVANLKNDSNIDAVLAKQCYVFSKEDVNALLIELYSVEIERMKNTILCGELTCYDFLHAKKRVCIKVAKIPEMYDILVKNKYHHRFDNYINMLIKNYLWGIRPLPPIESRAITFSEENLDIIFDNKLPNLVIYKIKKYIDIEDMITLENMNLFGPVDN